MNDPFLLGVLGFIQDEHERLLLCHHTYRPIPWSLPAGWMVQGESPLQGLERDVQEETGRVAQAPRLLRIGTTPDRPKLEFVVAARVNIGPKQVHAVQGCFPSRK